MLPIATEVHAASDLHRKQRPDETLQEYILNFMDLTEKGMEIDPAKITNHVIIFLFIKKLVQQMHQTVSSWCKGHQYISGCF